MRTPITLVAVTGLLTTSIGCVSPPPLWVVVDHDDPSERGIAIVDWETGAETEWIGPLECPQRIAASPDGTRVWVGQQPALRSGLWECGEYVIDPQKPDQWPDNIVENDIRIYDVGTRTLVHSIELANTAMLNGRGMAFNGEGEVWVSRAGSWDVYDAETFAVRQQVLVAGQGSGSIVFSPDDKFAYGASKGTVYRVSTEDHTVTQVQVAGAREFRDIDISGDGQTLYVTDSVGRKVHALDAGDPMNVVWTAPGEGDAAPFPGAQLQSGFLSPDGSHLYVNTAIEELTPVLTARNVGTGRLLPPIVLDPGCTNPWRQAALSPGGLFAGLLCAQSKTVLAVDLPVFGHSRTVGVTSTGGSLNDLAFVAYDGGAPRGQGEPVANAAR